MLILVHVVQSGGCDYTIGCGHRVYPINAPDLDQAQTIVEHQWFGLCETEPDPSGKNHANCRGGDQDIGLIEITLYHIDMNYRRIDLNKAETNRKLRVQETKAAEQRLKDEAQFEVLKRKLGK